LGIYPLSISSAAANINSLLDGEIQPGWPVRALLPARKGLDYFRLAPDLWADEVETVKAWKTSHA
jgi:hypothetical protein